MFKFWHILKNLVYINVLLWKSCLVSCFENLVCWNVLHRKCCLCLALEILFILMSFMGRLVYVNILILQFCRGTILLTESECKWKKEKSVVFFWKLWLPNICIKSLPDLPRKHFGIKQRCRTAILKITIKSIEKACHNNVLLTRQWKKSCRHSSVCYLKLTLKASRGGLRLAQRLNPCFPLIGDVLVSVLKWVYIASEGIMEDFVWEHLSRGAWSCWCSAST